MTTESISQLILAKAQQFGPKLAVCMYGEPAEQYTYGELDKASGRLAAEFRDMGIGPNDRIVILSESRPRWAIAFFATLRVGAVAVPLDARMTDTELSVVLEQVKSKLIVVSRQQELRVSEYLAHSDDGVFVMSIEAANASSEYSSVDVPHQNTTHPCVLRNENDAAVITFTSGTTGSSKGVVTTYGNLLHEIRSFRSVLKNDSRCTTVSILPLSHLFELTAGFLGVLYGGGRICFCESLMPTDIVAAMQEQKITCMVTVPLFLKLMASSIQKEIAILPLWQRRAFTLTRIISPHIPMLWRRRMFARIRERFGGALEYFICGGAPLESETRKFFDSIGLPVYQGYGLAEASPVIATNGPGANYPGSVGRPLPGVEVAIDERNGNEILTRGPHIMRGYLGDVVATEKMIDADGWLHTGDVGHISDDGYLFVSGRQKNIIVLGSGKKVQPEEVEDALFRHPLIQEGCVIGTIADRGLLAGSEEVCAIAVASKDAVMQFADRMAELRKEVRNVIEQQAKCLSPCKRPTRIVLRCEPLPRTSSRKVRRQNLREWISQETLLS